MSATGRTAGPFKSLDGPPAPKEAEAPRCIAWLRDYIRPYTRMMAFWDLAGDRMNEAWENDCEITVAAINIALEHKWPGQFGIAAARAEWARACREVTEFHTALRRRIWPLGKMQAPGKQIMTEANAVADKFNADLSSDQLTELVRQIALAAAPKSRPRYAKRAA